MGSNEICGARDSGYTCDMNPNHGGTYHADHGWHGRINHEWPNTGKSGTLDKDITKPPTLPRGLQDKQRLWDIVRYFRCKALDKELITQDEYAELAQEHGAVARLEEDDSRRAVCAAAGIQRFGPDPQRYKGAVCKGSLAIGTGCRDCERCAAEALRMLPKMDIAIAAVDSIGAEIEIVPTNGVFTVLGNDNQPRETGPTEREGCRYHSSHD